MIQLEHIQLLAQGNNNGAGAAAAGGMFAILMLLLQLALAILVIAGFWKTFEKAGKPGWAAIVPIYNIIVLLEIAGKPIWWILLFFIPCVNIIVSIIVSLDVAKNFGQGPGFGIGLALLGPIFYPILGFGKSQYRPVVQSQMGR